MCLKLLMVEDNESDLEVCRDTLKRYQIESGRKINLVESKTLDDALKEINKSFDGAIIDLRLDTEGDEGNKVIKHIHDSYRIPIAILTGTPQNADTGIYYLGVYKKGETGYDELFDSFHQVYDTGLTRILGGRGAIEQAMDRVFWDNILPHLEDWKNYVSSGKDTEKALLRFTISHLLELLDEDLETYFPEEMYISPPISTNIKTGSIVQNASKDYYVVLSPACDLAVHNGNIKTDRILVCFIEKNMISKAQKAFNSEIVEDDSEKQKVKKKKEKDRAERLLTQLPGNNFSNYYHYLPRTSRFNGGVINFRKVNTFKPREFKKEFGKPIIQISMAFAKDIVARFSSYYARQGQPDFDADVLEDLKRALQCKITFISVKIKSYYTTPASSISEALTDADAGGIMGQDEGGQDGNAQDSDEPDEDGRIIKRKVQIYL